MAKRGEANTEKGKLQWQVYLYQAVDVVAHKGKRNIISFAGVMFLAKMMLMGLRRFTKIILICQMLLD
jgi:hypothetical protein